MKSQPDAASRVAAEVVTQLPVPSRLGMLRFERLNEASWAMLYLDPACERHSACRRRAVRPGRLALRQPDGAGGTLQLHDEIQLQLAQRGHYRVRYTLHTGPTPLRLLEGRSLQAAQPPAAARLPDGARRPAGRHRRPRRKRSRVRNNRLQLALQLNQRAQQEQLNTWSGCAPSRT
jgi:hypothetical protein